MITSKPNTDKPNTDNAGQAKEGHSIDCDIRMYPYDVCSCGFENEQQLEQLQSDLASLRSQLSDAKSKADWLINNKERLKFVLKNAGQMTLERVETYTTAQFLLSDLQAILSNDGKAKEGGV